MKGEFEKLLGAINSLEEEKQHLESELERAKRQADQQGSSANVGSTAALERIKERFAKVNSELKQMREDKKGKESAFRLMQRENKQCDTLQRELKKLKESRVQMAKQQKTQALQMQKLRKDQAAKAVQFKKADVKKQQLVNTLKSELVKKERVMTIKDREIARVTMKLKVCEEHVVQLLKLQNKARNAPAAGKSGAAGSAIPVGKNGAAAGFRGKANLPAGEAEHLQSSKAMLEHMLMERLDRHVSRIVYEQKALQLAELNREMEGDAALLEELLAQKKELVTDLRARCVLPAVPGNVEGADVVATAEEAEFEEEVDIGLLCGAASNGLSEEEKYHISQLKTSIEMTESSLERMTKEVDLCNADIDELSLSMEADKGKAAAGRADPDSAWDEMGREILAGLSQGQSHALLWDLMDEKLKTLEQLRVTHNLLTRCNADLEQMADKNQELSDWVAALRAELKIRLERAEKLRVSDMWALMQASTGNAAALGDGAAVAAREDAASRIAILRAQELERELETALAAEDTLKEEMEQKAQAVRELQRKVSELSLRSEFAEAESTWTVIEGQKPSKELRSSPAPGPDSYLDSLFAIWEELGLPEEERAEALEYVQKSRSLAKERAVVDAQALLACAKDEVEAAKDALHVLSAALGQPAEQIVPALAPAVAPVLLLPLLDSIKAGTVKARAEIHEKLASLGAVKDRLTEVMSEMWLEIHDLSPVLRPLAKLVLPAPSAEESSDAAVTHVAEQLTGMKVSLLSITTWESEIKKLNLVRVQVTTKLITVRDAAAKLLGELQMRDVKSELSALMKGAALSTKSRDSGAEDQLSAQAVNAAVQILVANSASNPPGSEKLLAALERVKLVLESVKVNRSTVAQTASRLVEAYIEHFPQEEQKLLLAETDCSPESREAVLAQRKTLLQRAKGNALCSGPELTEAFAVAHAIDTRIKKLRAALHSEVCDVLSEISPTTTAAQGADLLAQHLLMMTGRGAAPLQLVQGMEETVEELEGLVMFVEERWVQDGVQAVVTNWQAGKSSTLLAEASQMAVVGNRTYCLIQLALSHRTLRCGPSCGGCRAWRRPSVSWPRRTRRCADTCRRWTSLRRSPGRTAPRLSLVRPSQSCRLLHLVRILTIPHLFHTTNRQLEAAGGGREVPQGRQEEVRAAVRAHAAALCAPQRADQRAAGSAHRRAPLPGWPQREGQGPAEGPLQGEDRAHAPATVHRGRRCPDLGQPLAHWPAGVRCLHHWSRGCEGRCSCPEEHQQRHRPSAPQRHHQRV
jgi:hypothetical protein